MSFDDRRDAGRRLAEQLRHLREEAPIVLGLPRGGVPVAYEVARGLRAPLDVVLVRKLGAPRNPEYGIGAVGEEGVRLLDDEAVARVGATEEQIERTVERERAELERRLERYRGGRSGAPVRGRVCILVDDGLATGVSATAAVRVLRERGAGRVVLAVPVGAPDSVGRLRRIADEVVCLHEPPSFMAVGTWYQDFSQTSDEEVVALLRRTSDELRQESHEQIPVGRVSLPGDLVVPPSPIGLVLFAHGSGSSRKSPRNQHVARILNDAGLATLLFDLLTPAEGQSRANVFDIELLGERLLAAARWARGREGSAQLPLGFFGASTGAAAALVAAAELGDEAGAVVSRGGRPDLAADRLPGVTAPTLLIVGGADQQVIELNEEAAAQLTVAEQELVIVEGAGHLFEGQGELDEVAGHAARWFIRHL
jgi:putative phosphoribosyl transferase